MGSSKAMGYGLPFQEDVDPSSWPEPTQAEGLVAYVHRIRGAWDSSYYFRLLGAANEFKEGDQIVGVAAVNDSHRKLARTLLANTRIEEIDSHPVLEDDLYRALNQSIDPGAKRLTSSWTFERLKLFLLEQPETAIQEISPGLSSDAIGCVVKLMDNEELRTLGSKVFIPLSGTKIGSKGYLGARIQPNSPTDNEEDIRWQVLCGWSYGVGDVLLGTNPVSSEPLSVAKVELALKDLLETFELTATMPHCVLSHIDVQAEVERSQPGSTALWFQSIAGSDSANATFDVSLEKMLHYAEIKGGPFGLYFETGQGADFTNGHSHGYDMVLHEARKYGFARLLSRRYAQSKSAQNPNGGPEKNPWVHLNDVAGFIGPEVFRTREQLVRCCLEDIVMGKLHGLCIGLDVCSTLHMSISLDDLDWCLEQLASAGPAYLMALPTKVDPMLGYLTTGFQDHVRLREKFGLKVNDAMWEFFKSIDVIDSDGNPTQHFGDPRWVYLQYCRRKADSRTDEQILDEANQQLARVRNRGIFVATGYGQRPSQLRPDLDRDIRRIYESSKQDIWSELDDAFRLAHPDCVFLTTNSTNRENYILHPTSGERLNEESAAQVRQLRYTTAEKIDVQVVVSDGLNANAINDQDQLRPFLQRLQRQLESQGLRVATNSIVVQSGRVRAGYQIGELMFGGLDGPRGVIHIIGERPGSGHHTFSAYFTCTDGSNWGEPGSVDHDQTKVVAGIANSALRPEQAADDVARLFKQMWSSQAR